MKPHISKTKMIILLITGIIGCVFMAGSDWIMIYGDTAYHGKLAWLTQGVIQIEPWRNSLAMLLAFPAVILYCIALTGMKDYFKDELGKKIYSFLTTVGFTPWLCLHLFYIMILYIFAWLQKNGHKDVSYLVGEKLFEQFGWVVIVGEIIIVIPFLYLCVATIFSKTVFSKWMALNNPLLIYVVLKIVTMFMPDTPLRLAFTNGLMSESMLVFFLIYIIGTIFIKDRSLGKIF